MEATLSARDRRLTIEDVCQWKGKIVNDEPFMNRFTLAKQWLDHYCIPGPDLQMELAQWSPLTSVRPDGVWELMDHIGRQRLRWICKSQDQTHDTKIAGITTASGLSGLSGLTGLSGLSGLTALTALTALATKNIGPDQWDLSTSDGTPLGRGLIRSMEISSMMRGNTQPCKVEVKWVSSFKKWEILKLSQESLNTRENFESQKVEDGI
jgi:hypothetical protein